jgi:hypothetical protein
MVRCCGSKSDLCVTYSLAQHTPLNSIKSYFDFLCRDASLAAMIGNYFGLRQEETLCGNDYDPSNPAVTYVPMDLNASRIELGKRQNVKATS